MHPPRLLLKAPARGPEDAATRTSSEDAAARADARVHTAHTAHTRVPMPPRPRQVLIVDDDEFMLDMLPLHLQPILGPDVRILTAATPEDALSLLADHHDAPLVVLSDYDLRATTDGVDLLEEVARRRPDAVRILFSGQTGEEIGDRLAATAVHAFLEKPFRLNDMMPSLVAAIQEQLGRRGGP